jgi:hypothetical protein
MTETPHGQRRSSRTAPVAVRLVAALVAAPLLLWAYEILDNIWNYNDSGALSYAAFAAIPGVPGLLAAVFAVRGRLRL